MFNEAGWEKKEEKVKALVFACDRLRDALKSSVLKFILFLLFLDMLIIYCWLC